MLSNSTSQAAAAAAAAAAGIPFNPFITPNFTINNGLMLQHRSGGFKLTVGEDGRLILQHDPTLNQDLQSQLLLQSIFGLNGGLVLQPSIDQQVCSLKDYAFLLNWIYTKHRIYYHKDKFKDSYNVFSYN